MSTTIFKASGAGVARAFADDLRVMVVCRFKERISNCLGLMVERIEMIDNQETVTSLTSPMRFPGQSNPDWASGSTSDYPLQQCLFFDESAPTGRKLRYRITPRVGSPGNLSSREDLILLTEEPVELTTEHGTVSFYTNRGLVATQGLAHELGHGLDGKPDSKRLEEQIHAPGNPKREYMSGNLLVALRAIFEEANQTGGSLWAALYELSDEEVISKIIENKHLLRLILGNAGTNDDTNKAARARLHKAGVDIQDRMLVEGHLPHCKLFVLLDANGHPIAVLVCTDNMTATGLCGQTNCCFLIRNSEVAEVFYDYLQRMFREGDKQSKEFREANAAVCNAPPIVLPDGSSIRVGLAPCTPQETKPTHNTPVSPGMKLLYDFLESAEKLALLHEFIPGIPSVISKVQELAKIRPQVQYRAIVNGAEALPHPKPPHEQSENEPEVRQHNKEVNQPKQNVDPGTDIGDDALFGYGPNCDLIAAAAIEKAIGPFIPELLRVAGGHASTHAKAMTKDPLDEVENETKGGSSNDGEKSQYENDDINVFVRGNKSLAVAASVFILWVFYHYLPRWMLHIHRSDFNGYLKPNESWQDEFESDTQTGKLIDYFLGIPISDKSAADHSSTQKLEANACSSR